MNTKTTTRDAARSVRKYEEEREGAIENLDVNVSFMMRGPQFEKLEAVVLHMNLHGAGVYASDLLREAIDRHVKRYIKNNGLVI